MTNGVKPPTGNATGVEEAIGEKHYTVTEEAIGDEHEEERMG